MKNSVKKTTQKKAYMLLRIKPEEKEKLKNIPIIAKVYDRIKTPARQKGVSVEEYTAVVFKRKDNVFKKVNKRFDMDNFKSRRDL